MTDESELEALLDAPDRDRIPGARPLVACLADGDDPAFEDEVRARTRRAFALRRRGADQGRAVELDAPRKGVDPAECARRWLEADPFVLPALVTPGDLGSRLELFERLQTPGGLRSWLAGCPRAGHEVLDREPRLADPERDVERVALRAPDGKELWAKSARLSTHAEDRSLRVRFSFGAEGRDDASRDLARHRHVAALAEAVLPEARAIREASPLRERVEGWLGSQPLFTQHIAYWNAPQGGALFHHDAFAESSVGGQRGVVYTQLLGETLWLALPIRQLAFRVIEFVRWLTEGDLPHLVAGLGEAGLMRLQGVASDPDRVVAELAEPGCGDLGPIVNQGPEFTGLLLDAGHGFVLGPGDAVVLPNHGTARTAMHSVWCASDAPTFALSIALREAQPPPPEPVRMGRSTAASGPKRGARRRRRSRGGRRGG